MISKKISIPSPIANYSPRKNHPSVKLRHYPPLYSDSSITPPCVSVKKPSPNDMCEPRYQLNHKTDKSVSNNDPILPFLEKQNRLTEILSDQYQQSLLPSLSLSSFKGDPTECHIFMRNFEMRIETRLRSSEARLQ